MAASKTKKGRKFGRNQEKCARYRAAGQREKNKARVAAKLKRLSERKAARLAGRVGTDAD